MCKMLKEAGFFPYEVSVLHKLMSENVSIAVLLFFKRFCCKLGATQLIFFLVRNHFIFLDT